MKTFNVYRAGEFIETIELEGAQHPAADGHPFGTWVSADYQSGVRWVLRDVGRWTNMDAAQVPKIYLAMDSIHRG